MNNTFNLRTSTVFVVKIIRNILKRLIKVDLNKLKQFRIKSWSNLNQKISLDKF